MDFEWLLDRLWLDFGGQVGAKLAQKSAQEGVETDVKNMSKNDHQSVMQKSRDPAARGCVVP